MCQSQATLSTFEISNNYNQKHRKYQKDDTYREAAYASRRRHKKLLPSAPGDSKNLVQKHHKGLTPLLHFTDKRQRVYMSHFAYACKMRYPLNLVLENIEYLSFY